MTVASPLRSAAFAQARTWWRGLSLRERRGLQLAGLAVGLTAVWLVALSPALRTLRELPPKQAALDNQWAEMLTLADEARSLRALPATAPERQKAALDAAVQRLGPLGQLTWQGDRATLRLQPMPSARLVTLLGELRAGARAQILEAQMQQSGPGQWQGTLTLALPEGAS